MRSGNEVQHNFVTIISNYLLQKTFPGATAFISNIGGVEPLIESGAICAPPTAVGEQGFEFCGGLDANPAINDKDRVRYTVYCTDTDKEQLHQSFDHPSSSSTSKRHRRSPRIEHQPRTTTMIVCRDAAYQQQEPFDRSGMTAAHAAPGHAASIRKRDKR